MKYKLSLSFAFAVSLCFMFAFTTGAQREEASDPPTLADASAKLADAFKDQSNPPSKYLADAAANFIKAAKTPENKSELERATNGLQEALNAERKKSEANNKPFRRGGRVLAIEAAIATANQVLTPGKDSSPTPPALRSPSTGGTGNDREKDGGLMGLVVPVAIAVGAALLIVLAVFAILRLRRGYWARLDNRVIRLIQAHTVDVKHRQEELGKRIVALGTQHQTGSSRLESIEGELQALARRVRGLSDGRAFQADSTPNVFEDYSRPQTPPPEPEFPASVSEYLDKMKRNSTVVKPDFQNGILVNDLDGKGEFMLIRDTRVADSAQPLFLVPRVGQFQTKQEFHAYYERYYECQRPTAGDVWIIDPAIVSTVPGGWQLREKGVLEVR